MSTTRWSFRVPIQTIHQVTCFCRAIYHRTFGPMEGEQRLSKLTFKDAVLLWYAGLPESANSIFLCGLAQNGGSNEDPEA